MKAIYKALALTLVMSAGFSSCAKFLDVVPDERTKESDTYADRNKGLDYLYSCYAYLPNPVNTVSGLDLMTGDEVITAFEHETFSSFPKGKYTASNPVISYWNTLFRGIRQCYMFLENIDKIRDTSDAEKADFKAQVRFLIAYYHYELIRCYGPVTLVKELPNINASADQFPGRTPYDECVQWVCDQFDEAAKGLPARRDGTTGSDRPLTSQKDYGLATSTAAKALKAKLLVYAASPLFNGNPMYADFKDKDGVALMPTTYDPHKWVKAKDALKEAIQFAESNGYTLYQKDDFEITSNQYPAAGVERRMRTLLVDWKAPHPEVIFADTRGPGAYDLQLKSVPRTKDQHNSGANGVSLTWAMLNRFYTENGLPWDEDPAYKNLNKLELVTGDASNVDHLATGKQTIRFNLGREPRFYSWVTFQGGYYEIKTDDADVYPINQGFMIQGQPHRVVMDFLKNGNQGRKGRTNNYSPGGYLNKKGVRPDMLMRRGGPAQFHYPWPVIRLADLYLLYAEACVEANELADAKTYLNKVRVRAGIPTVETSWAMVPGVTLDQNKLRQIVRQERQVELYLENQNFWDMRRWLLAEEAFGKKAQGLNIEANDVINFAQLTEISFERAFISPNHYLMPIPTEDINKNEKLVNNPGY